MAKKRNLLDRLDEVRTNSVTPEEFEKAWGMSVEEYREQIRAFSKEQDAALAEKKRKESSPRIVVIAQTGTGKGRVTYGPGVIRAAKSAYREALIKRVKTILAKQKKGLGLTDMQKTLLKNLGVMELKDVTALQCKRMGLTDASNVDMSIGDKHGVIGGAGGKASRRKGVKGRKGPKF